MSVASVITQGFGTFGTVNLVVTDGYATGVRPEPVPDISISGVKRRPYRVRRADFSTEEAYELALKMAMADARFAIKPFAEPPQVVPEPVRRPVTIPVDASLAKTFDGEIKVSAANYAKLQRSSEMEEMALMQLFIMAIEEDL